MNYLKFTLWCLLGVTTISCNKEKKYTCIAQGKVIEAATGKPIPNAKVRLQDGVGNSGPINFGNSSSGINTEIYTNANGEFNLQIEGEYSPFISVYEAKHFGFNNGSEQLKGLRTGTNSNLILTLESEAKFNGIFINKFHKEIDTSYVTVFTYKDKLFGTGQVLYGIQPLKFYDSVGGLRVPGSRYVRIYIYI